MTNNVEVMKTLNFKHSETEISETKTFLEEKSKKIEFAKIQLKRPIIIIELLMVLLMTIVLMINWFKADPTVKSNYWNQITSGNWSDELVEIFTFCFIFLLQIQLLILLAVFFIVFVLLIIPIMKKAKIQTQKEKLERYLFLKEFGSYNQFNETEKTGYIKIHNYKTKSFEKLEKIYFFYLLALCFVILMIGSVSGNEMLFWIAYGLTPGIAIAITVVFLYNQKKYDSFFERKYDYDLEFLERFDSWFDDLLIEIKETNIEQPNKPKAKILSSKAKILKLQVETK